MVNKPEMEQLQVLQREVQPLQQQLQELQKKKEEAFSNKEKLKQKVHDLGNKLKEFRSKRNQQMSGITDARKSRDEAKKSVQELKEQLKVLRQQKSLMMQKQEFRGNPETLKQKIGKLEMSIETEGYDYDKEQRVMEQIKKLKAVYSQLEGFVKCNEQIKHLQLQMSDALDKHNVFSSVIRQSHLSKEEYEQFKQTLNDFKKTKEEQEKAFDYFIEQKNEFNALRGTYKEKHKQLISLRKQLGQEVKIRKEQQQRTRKRKEENILAEKAKAVEEKWKTGKKLDTQDLIALQGKT